MLQNMQLEKSYPRNKKRNRNSFVMINVLYFTKGLLFLFYNSVSQISYSLVVILELSGVMERFGPNILFFFYLFFF